MAECLETANEIIGLNYYELEKDYASIFSAQNEGNKELMFVVRAEPLADYGNHTYANILPGDYASPHGNIVEGWSGHRMPWEFYDTFDEMIAEELWHKPNILQNPVLPLI